MFSCCLRSKCCEKSKPQQHPVKSAGKQLEKPPKKIVVQKQPRNRSPARSTIAQSSSVTGQDTMSISAKGYASCEMDFTKESGDGLKMLDSKDNTIKSVQSEHSKTAEVSIAQDQLNIQSTQMD